MPPAKSPTRPQQVRKGPRKRAEVEGELKLPSPKETSETATACRNLNEVSMSFSKASSAPETDF